MRDRPLRLRIGRRDPFPAGRGSRHLQDLLGTRARADHYYRTQVIDRLTPEMAAWILRQPEVYLATFGLDGLPWCSIRRGKPPVVQVLHERAVAFGELPGNGAWATAGNVLDTRALGLFFYSPGDRIGLHLTGRARVGEGQPTSGIIRDPDPRMALWIVADVERAAVHRDGRIGDPFHLRGLERPWL